MQTGAFIKHFWIHFIASSRLQAIFDLYRSKKNMNCYVKFEYLVWNDE